MYVCMYVYRCEYMDSYFMHGLYSIAVVTYFVVQIPQI